jgi:hypothetical protein
MTDEPISGHQHPTMMGTSGLAGCGCTPEEAANVDLILRYRQASAADRPGFFTADYRRHRPGMAHLADITGVSGSGMIGEEAFPDRADRILEVIASGDRVCAVWEVTGTHRGEFHGIAPTGANVRLTEVGLWRIEGGKIAESWFLADETALLMALGLLDARGGEGSSASSV